MGQFCGAPAFALPSAARSRHSPLMLKLDRHAASALGALLVMLPAPAALALQDTASQPDEFSIFAPQAEREAETEAAEDETPAPQAADPAPDPA